MIDSINSASAGWSAIFSGKTKPPKNSQPENALQSGTKLSINTQSHTMNSAEQRFASIMCGAQKNTNDALYSNPATRQQAGNNMQADNLSVGIKHMLEKIVDDPAYGAEYADGYSNNIHTACMTLPEFMQAQGTLEAGQDQLQAAWRNIQGEGKSPAQSYAELLKYELSMPQSYWNAQDPGRTMPDIRAFAVAKLAYLEQYMAAGK